MNAMKAAKTAGGVVLLVAGLAVTAVAIGHVSFDRRVRGETDALLRTAGSANISRVTDEMVDELPDPVRRYLHWTGVVGARIPRTVHLRQTGTMRMSPGADPIPLEAEQWYTTDPPGFVWDGRLTKGFVPVARARDRYFQGRGDMYVRAAEVYPVVDEEGPEMDQGSMMRYLQEMIAWFPAALFEDYVSFEQVAENAVDVTFADGERRVTGRFFVGADGRYEDFVAERYRSVEGGFEPATWRAPLTEYGEINGLKLGIGGRGVWELEPRDYEYIDLTVTHLEYD